MRPQHPSGDAGPRSCSISPRTPGGVVSPAQLEAIASVARRFAVPMLKIMSSQRILLMGVPMEEAGSVLEALASAGVPAEVAGGHGGSLVQACPGSRACPNGLQDTIAMGERVELRLRALAEGMDLPGKVRVGISGCPRCCGESYVRDIGLVGGKQGWTLAFGGNAGARPRAADQLGSGLDEDAALGLMERALAHYAANARKNQRTARFVEACGIADLRAALGLDEPPA
ncbi:MAG: NAD(P)/FAD-dependent oxidoreductase [Desulfovibrio sp.]|nr:NAD(P)/FAD-dependent oxidoreductase [Desulfovibrio sp.]